MARVSPYFDLTCSSTTNWAGYVNYTLTDDPANNRTKVDAELWAYKVEASSGGNNPLFAPTITIDGVTYGSSSDRYTTEYKTHTKHLTVSGVYVYHNTNGEKTLTISGKVTKITDPSDYATSLDGKSVTGSKTITLTDYLTGYTLFYDANGGSGAPNSLANITSTTISSTIPTRSGYDFLGWSTSSSATTASYVAGDSISLTSNTTLYAVWRKFYTVTYDANGGYNAPSSDKKLHGETLILTSAEPTSPEGTSVTYTVTFNANGGSCDTDMMTTVSTTTYKFYYWNTEPDGSGNIYNSGSSYVYNNDITLYAFYGWTKSYPAITLPTPTRNGYMFLGWSTNEFDTSGIVGRYNPEEDVTLYAVWELGGNVYIHDDAGGFNPYQVFIYDDDGWSQYVPYIYTESGWEMYSG